LRLAAAHASVLNSCRLLGYAGSQLPNLTSALARASLDFKIAPLHQLMWLGRNTRRLNDTSNPCHAYPAYWAWFVAVGEGRGKMPLARRGDEQAPHANRARQCARVLGARSRHKRGKKSLVARMSVSEIRGFCAPLRWKQTKNGELLERQFKKLRVRQYAGAAIDVLLPVWRSRCAGGCTQAYTQKRDPQRKHRQHRAGPKKPDFAGICALTSRRPADTYRPLFGRR
jgi:hypothetical protein